MTNGAYGSKSHGGHKSDRDETIKDDRLLDTLDKRGYGHKFYSSSGFHRHYDRHCYHPYMRSDRGYFLDEFKKSKPPTFDGDLKKLEDFEAWLLGMNKLFEFHDYTENMKAKIIVFSLKGKTYIWWE